MTQYRRWGFIRWQDGGWQFGCGSWLKFHSRTHHPEIPFGCWRLCINGVQFFAGSFAMTAHWPIRRAYNKLTEAA